MVNRFENDISYIGTAWLWLGCSVWHKVRVSKSNITAHYPSRTQDHHILAILPDNQYVCDCCMGMNISIPCHHYFQALSIL